MWHSYLPCRQQRRRQTTQLSKLALSSFSQCDRENNSKAKSQAGFISFVVLPAYKVRAATPKHPKYKGPAASRVGFPRHVGWVCGA